MSRSGYHDDGDMWELICWRGAVESALGGKRGQAFLREMLTALDALPQPRLIKSALVTPDGCCAMGAVALARGADVSDVNEYEAEQVGRVFGIARAMAAEIAYINDDENDGASGHPEQTPEVRFARVRRWVTRNINPTPEEI